MVTGAQIAETDPDGKDTQLSKFYLTVCWEEMSKGWSKFWWEIHVKNLTVEALAVELSTI